MLLKSLVIILIISESNIECSRYADQLYEDLMYYYNKNVRPVANSTQALKVKFGASLIRLIDVVSGFKSDKEDQRGVDLQDEVNQVLTTNLWLEMVSFFPYIPKLKQFQQWYDYKLKWDPAKFNNIKKLHIPSDQIWIPGKISLSIYELQLYIFRYSSI